MAANVPFETVRAGTWSAEARALAQLAGPIALTMLGQVAIQTTDVIMIGWLGATELAASTLGVASIFVLFVVGMGLMYATAPMIAQDLGKKRHAVREPRRTVRQGLWVAAVIGVPAGLILWNLASVLSALGQDPRLIALVEPYARAALFSLVPGLWFICLRNFIAALERPAAGMVVMLIGVLVNAIANYVLIFGAPGIPALGLLGAGIATALTNGFLFAALLAFILIDRRFRRYRLLGRFWRPDCTRFVEIFRLGLPISLTLLFEIGLFAGAAFLIGAIDPGQLAAHQIALQVASVSFMVPLGIAQAGTVRVALAVGRRDPDGVRLAGGTALAMGLGFMALMALLLVTLARQIVGLFLDLADPANQAVIGYAVTFLWIAAGFQLFDGAQVIGAGLLRGLKDTRWPMVFAGFGYWVVGLGTSVALGFGAGLGGLGVWIGFVVGLATAATLLVTRFVRLQQRFAITTTRPMPETVTTPT